MTWTGIVLPFIVVIVPFFLFQELKSNDKDSIGNSTEHIKPNLTCKTEPSRKSKTGNVGYAGMRKGFLSMNFVYCHSLHFVTDL